jgi:hypothetical protein
MPPICQLGQQHCHGGQVRDTITPPLQPLAQPRPMSISPQLTNDLAAVVKAACSSSEKDKDTSAVVITAFESVLEVLSACKTSDRAELLEVQGSIEASLMALLKSTSLSIPLAKAIGECYALLFTEGNSRSMYPTLSACSSIVSSKTEAFVTRTGCAIALGVLLQTVGRQVMSYVPSIVEGLGRLAKSPEESARMAAFEALRGVSIGVGSGGAYLHPDIFKIIRSAASQEKSSAVVRIAIYRALSGLLESDGDTASIFEGTWAICVKGGEDSRHEVRVAAAATAGMLLGLTLLDADRVRRKEEPPPKRSRPQILALLNTLILNAKGSSQLQLVEFCAETLKATLRIWQPTESAVVALIAGLVEAIDGCRVTSAWLYMAAALKIGLIDSCSEASQLVLAAALLETLGRSQSSGTSGSGHLLCMGLLSSLVEGLGDAALSLADALEECILQGTKSSHPLIRSLAAHLAMLVGRLLPLRRATWLSRLFSEFALGAVELQGLLAARKATGAVNGSSGSVRWEPAAAALSGAGLAVALLIDQIDEAGAELLPASLIATTASKVHALLQTALQCGEGDGSRQWIEGSWLILTAILRRAKFFAQVPIPDILLLIKSVLTRRPEGLHSSQERLVRWEMTLRTGALRALHAHLLGQKGVHPKLNASILKHCLYTASSLGGIARGLRSSCRVQWESLKGAVCCLTAEVAQETSVEQCAALLSFCLNTCMQESSASAIRAAFAPWILEIDEAFLEMTVPDYPMDICPPFLKSLQLLDPIGSSLLGVKRHLSPDCLATLGAIRCLAALICAHETGRAQHLAKIVQASNTNTNATLSMGMLPCLIACLRRLSELRLGGLDGLSKVLWEVVRDNLSDPDPLIRHMAAYVGGEACAMLSDRSAHMWITACLQPLSVGVGAMLPGAAVCLGHMGRSLGGLRGSPFLAGMIAALTAVIRRASISPIVHACALHGLSLTVDGCGLSQAAYTSAALNAACAILHSMESSNPVSHALAGRLVNALLGSAGPELTASSKSMRRARGVESSLRLSPYSTVRSESVAFIQQLVLAAPNTVDAAEAGPFLLGLAAGADEPQLRRAAGQCARLIAERGLTWERSDEAFVCALESARDEPLREEFRLAVGVRLDALIESAPGQYLQLCKRLMSGVGAGSEGHSGGVAEGPGALDEGRSDHAHVHPHHKKHGDNEGAENDHYGGGNGGDQDGVQNGVNPMEEDAEEEQDEDEDVEHGGAERGAVVVGNPVSGLQSWQTKLFAANAILKLLMTCPRSDEAHWNIVVARQVIAAGSRSKDSLLISHLGDLVRLAFNSATSPAPSLRPIGLETLLALLDCFSLSPDPDFAAPVDGMSLDSPQLAVSDAVPSILAQHAASISASFRAALTPGSHPLVAQLACEVAAAYVRGPGLSDPTACRRAIALLRERMQSDTSTASSAPSSTSGSRKPMMDVSEIASGQVRLAAIGSLASLWEFVYSENPVHAPLSESRKRIAALLTEDAPFYRQCFLDFVRDHAVYSIFPTTLPSYQPVVVQAVGLQTACYVPIFLGHIYPVLRAAVLPGALEPLSVIDWQLLLGLTTLLLGSGADGRELPRRTGLTALRALLCHLPPIGLDSQLPLPPLQGRELLHMLHYFLLVSPQPSSSSSAPSSSLSSTVSTGVLSERCLLLQSMHLLQQHIPEVRSQVAIATMTLCRREKEWKQAEKWLPVVIDILLSAVTYAPEMDGPALAVLLHVAGQVGQSGETVLGESQGRYLQSASQSMVDKIVEAGHWETLQAVVVSLGQILDSQDHLLEEAVNVTGMLSYGFSLPLLLKCLISTGMETNELQNIHVLGMRTLLVAGSPSHPARILALRSMSKILQVAAPNVQQLYAATLLEPVMQILANKALTAPHAVEIVRFMGMLPTVFASDALEAAVLVVLEVLGDMLDRSLLTDELALSTIQGIAAVSPAAFKVSLSQLTAGKQGLIEGVIRRNAQQNAQAAQGQWQGNRGKPYSASAATKKPAIALKKGFL